MYLKMGGPGCLLRIGRCSVLTAKSLIKQAEANSSQAVGVTVKTAIELWWNDAKNTGGDPLHGQNQELN